MWAASWGHPPPTSSYLPTWTSCLSRTQRYALSASDERSMCSSLHLSNIRAPEWLHPEQHSLSPPRQPVFSMGIGSLRAIPIKKLKVDYWTTKNGCVRSNCVLVIGWLPINLGSDLQRSTLNILVKMALKISTIGVLVLVVSSLMVLMSRSIEGYKILNWTE